MTWLGLDDPGGPWYLFWSGIGSDLAYLGVFSVLFRHFNCEAPRCRGFRGGHPHYCPRHR